MNSGLKALVYVNIISHVLCLWLIPTLLAFGSFLAFSFAALPWLPPCQPDSRFADCGWDKYLAIWEDKYFGLLGRSKVSEKPAGRLLSSQLARQEAGLCYVSALVLSHFSCGHPFLLLTLASRTAGSSNCDFGKS